METENQEKNTIDPAIKTGPENVDETTTQVPAPLQEPATPRVEPVKTKLTRRERLEFAKSKIESELDELDAQEDDTRPLTVGEFKRMTQEGTKKTALQLADSKIDNEDERAEVKEILESRIIPSDDPEKDLQTARDMVNATKHRLLLEEEARKKNPQSHAHTPGNPGNVPEPFTPTELELVMMRPPYNLSQQEVLEARKKQQAQ